MRDYKKLQGEERVDALERDCRKIDDYTYTVDASEVDLDRAMEEYVACMDEISELMAALKEITQSYKNKIKGIQEKSMDPLDIMRTRLVKITELVYQVADDQEIVYVNADGAVVGRRKMYDNEKQLHINEGADLGEELEAEEYPGEEDLPGEDTDEYEV
jgi:hypothetical protein